MNKDIRPEDVVEAGVYYLESQHGDESTRLQYLESVYEGLLQIRFHPGPYFQESQRDWIVAHFPEILAAARTLILIEKSVDPAIWN